MFRQIHVGPTVGKKPKGMRMVPWVGFGKRRFGLKLPRKSQSVQWCNEMVMSQVSGSGYSSYEPIFDPSSASKKRTAHFDFTFAWLSGSQTFPITLVVSYISIYFYLIYSVCIYIYIHVILYNCISIVYIYIHAHMHVHVFRDRL